MTAGADLTYAVGDVHGCHDLLTALLEAIEQHAEGRPRHLVFLGDYIDRGPDSAAVIATVRAQQGRAPDRVTCLMGNHESMLLTAAADPAALPWWLRNGGDATLSSLKVARPRDISDDILDWMRGLPTFHEDERRCYVHAGLRPRVAREAQSDEDRLWIREPFLTTEWDFGKLVVHGHTPVPTARPDLRRFRVNLDTGAVFGGALTAGVFTADRTEPIAFLRVRAGPL